jgi:hypothetical protein
MDIKSRKLSEDELDLIQNKIFDSLLYGLFVLLGLTASLYCGMLLWALF